MERDDSKLGLARRARAARARTILVDLGGGALLAFALVLWLAREGVAIGAADIAGWAHSLDRSEQIGLPILAGIVLVAAQNARMGPASSGSAADEQRAEARAFGEISCLAATCLHGAALFTAWVVLRAEVVDVNALVLAGCATVLAVVVSCLSSAVRRPTYCDDEMFQEEAAALIAAADGWRRVAHSPTWWRLARLPLIGVVPGATAMLFTSVRALRFDVAGHVGDVAVLTACGACLGVLSVGAHFNGFRTIVLALVHGRPVLAAVVVVPLVAFDVLTTRAMLAGAPTAWAFAMALVLIGTAVAFAVAFVMVMRRSKWPGLGLAPSVRASLLREAHALGGAGVGAR